MERRTFRVSPRQWDILIELIERHPSLARSRGYNNSAHGRAEASRLWQEAAEMLNSQGSGTTKTAKDWSIYVSNYKSKLKRLVADINANASATGGGPPSVSSHSLSEYDQRFLAVMGEGFGQTNQAVRINPFPETPEASTSVASQPPILTLDSSQLDVDVLTEEEIGDMFVAENVEMEEQRNVAEVVVEPSPSVVPNNTSAPQRSRRIRQRSRPLAPLEEARRVLSQVEMQRAAADTAQAHALEIIGQSLARLAQSHESIGQSLSRLADIAERYMNNT